MSQLELHREEDLRLFPMTTLSSMNTIYATGSPLSNRTPSPRSPFFTAHSRHIHRDPSCPLWSASSFYSSPFFYGLNQERCSASIANWLRRQTFITRRPEVCTVEMRARGKGAGEKRWLLPRVIITITHFVSQVNVNQLISHPRYRFRFLLHLREAKR